MLRYWLFAQVEKGKGAFWYYKTGHDKKTVSLVSWRSLEANGYTYLLMIIHECTVMIHKTCVTVLTREEEILKTVESSWFQKALIWYIKSAWRLVIRCCLFILVITINPEVAWFVHICLSCRNVSTVTTIYTSCQYHNWTWALRYWHYGTDIF